MSSFSNRRHALRVAVSGFALAAFAPNIALADAPAPAPAAEQAAAPEAPAATDIVVTGTRVRRPDYNTASPVVSFGSALLQQSGTVNFTDFLTSLPALLNSSGAYANSGDRAGIGTTGLNLLNLRNLGTDRTLVLIDGRRHVSGLEGSQSVDISTIPEDLVERTDILTGGASAIYGADAVTGVVNFVLKKNFDGLTVRAQSGISKYGDNGNRLVAATWGKNFAGGRGNIALSYEYSGEDELTSHQRSEYTGPAAIGFFRNPDYHAGTAGSYSRIPLDNVSYGLTSRKGAVNILDGDYPSFNGLGQPYNLGTTLPGGYSRNSEDTLVSDYANDLRPRVDRHIVNVLGHYDVSPALKFYFEGKYAKTKSYSLAQPTFDYNLPIRTDNPFMPASIRGAAADNGMDHVQITRDNFDLGQRGESIKRETFRTVIGARGELGSSLHYDVSYVFGQTNVTTHFINDRYTDRWLAAIDAVNGPDGKPTCRVNVDPTDAAAAVSFKPGACVPFNVFGEGVASKASIDFIRAATTEHTRQVQHVASGSLSGDTHSFFNLPGGPVSFAVGSEFRWESSTFVPDQLEVKGLTFSNVLNPSHGSYSVKEAFGELDLPLIHNKPFFEVLDFSAAARVSDYTSTGTSTTWKFDGTWAPIRDIKFRGTLSRSVRSPNISELYGAKSQTFFFFDDPCIVSNRTLGKPPRAANCQALLAQSGLTPAQIAKFDDTRSVNIAGTQGGNGALRPEVANTWTAGVVLQPSFTPGLSVSFDWYNIKIKQAINTVDPQQLADLCVDQQTIDNPFCKAIIRAPGTGLISDYALQPQNVASFQTAGLDINLDYHVSVKKFGTVFAKIVGNYLNKLTTVGTPGAAPTDELAQYKYTSPKYQFYTNVGFNTGNFTFDYSWSWFDKTQRYTPDKLAGNPNYVAPQYVWVKARSVHNIYASVDVEKNFTFYGGVTNILNQKPDLGFNSYPTEAIGQSFFIGAKVKY
ncbi:TonB-dependent receptor [Novosphingobium sp.]|uniref:TonB-dependent receptor plug domain-containing protein n=1 Tax=Novosphingobium sp. TaxID=1874826 RepID=UPI00333E41F1